LGIPFGSPTSSQRCGALTVKTTIRLARAALPCDGGGHPLPSGGVAMMLTLAVLVTVLSDRIPAALTHTDLSAAGLVSAQTSPRRLIASQLGSRVW
jgi:hypothetical protein